MKLAQENLVSVQIRITRKAIAEVLRKIEDKGTEVAVLCEQDTTELNTFNDGLKRDKDRAEDKFIKATED